MWQVGATLMPSRPTAEAEVRGFSCTGSTRNIEKRLCQNLNLLFTFLNKGLFGKQHRLELKCSLGELLLGSFESRVVDGELGQ
jgi:hypothetical protein